MVYPGTLFHRRQRGIPMHYYEIGVKSEHWHLDEGAEEALARGDVELHVDRRVREAHGEVRLQRVRLPDLRWRRRRCDANLACPLSHTSAAHGPRRYGAANDKARPPRGGDQAPARGLYGSMYMAPMAVREIFSSVRKFDLIFLFWGELVPIL